MADEEIDIEALEKHVQESLAESEEVTEEVEVEAEAETEQVEEEVEEVEEEVDLDAIINSETPVALEGKITEDQAKVEAEKRGWREDGRDRFGHKISAIEFLERTPFFRKIDRMNDSIEEQNKRIETLAEQNKQIAQKSIEDKKKLNEELKATKEKLLSNEVLDSDDIEELKSLDAQIEETSVETKAEPEMSEEDKEFINDYEKKKAQFVKDNKWYGTDDTKTKWADRIGTRFAEEYVAKNKVLPPAEVTFQYVVDELNELFPEKPRKTRVATSSNRTVATKTSKSKSLNDIPEDQRMIAKEVMEATGISEDEYMKDYRP